MIFARIGAVLMMLPGVGESYVPPRIRLSLALVISLALWPVVAGSLPPLPDSLGGMAGWILREVLVGLVVGVVIGLFQALTQIQEQTLIYAPKIVAIFVSLLIFLPLMGALMSGFMRQIAARIAAM